MCLAELKRDQASSSAKVALCASGGAGKPAVVASLLEVNTKREVKPTHVHGIALQLV